MNRSEQEKVFLEWISEHEALLWKVARAFALPGREGDMHQDLLIAVWKAVPSWRAESKVSTFLYRVAHNAALISVTRARRVRFEPIPASAPSPSADPLVEELYAAIRKLAPAERSLALLYLDGLSYSEISDVLGITAANVGVRINRLKKRLSEIVHGS